jgi:hypothetical protein
MQELKICKDCKHCTKLGLGTHRYDYGCKRNCKIEIDLVIGQENVDYTNILYCDVERCYILSDNNITDRCGKEGRYFEQR